MTRRVAGWYVLAVVLLAFAGLVGYAIGAARSQGVAAAPVVTGAVQDPVISGDACVDPPEVAAEAVHDFRTAEGQGPGDVMRALVADQGSMLVAVREGSGSAAQRWVYLLQGGPVYDITEVNERFPGYGRAASCLVGG
jgi:hypothetical protein